ncbi:hypothetical protein NXY56_000194 [Leishmania guyanensis]
MPASTASSCLTYPLNAADAAAITTDGGSDNDASTPPSAVLATAEVNGTDKPIELGGRWTAVRDTRDERAPPRVTGTVKSETALANLLALCLDRIHRLEERQARGEALQNRLDTSLHALLTQAHREQQQQQQQQQQSSGPAAVEEHRAHGAGDANSSEAYDGECNEPYHRSRQTTNNSHNNCDRATAAATSTAALKSHSQQRRRQHGADEPAYSLGSLTPADAAAPTASTSAKGREEDDALTKNGAGSQHHHHESLGAVPSLSPASLANTKWKEVSSGAGAGIGGGCARAIFSTTSSSSHCNTLTASVVVASDSTNEPPMVSHLGASLGVCRLRQSSLVTVLRPTHTSQAEAHAIAAAADTLSTPVQVSSGNATAASTLISAGVSSTPASATPMSGLAWAVPMVLLSSSENSCCSTPVEFHMSIRPPSQQQQHSPTQPSAEEERPSCLSGPLAERAVEAAYDRPDVTSSAHQEQQRGSRQHLRSPLTQVPPLIDHPQQQQAQLHPQTLHRNSEECEARESASSRVSPTATRGSGSTTASSAAYTGAELDAFYQALSTPRPGTPFFTSSGSAAATGSRATVTAPRKVPFPPGTDNTTAINELFAQTVLNTMDVTSIKDNFTTLVHSVHEEQEKRHRFQRRVGSAVKELFRRVLAMSSMVSRLQRRVRQLESGAGSDGAAEAADWHHHHSSHRERRGTDNNRSASVSDQNEDGATFDGDIDNSGSERHERFCASLSTASVATSRSRRASSYRRSIGDRSGNARYAVVAVPFSSSRSLSVGCERVPPAGRSPRLSSLTTQCLTGVARGEAMRSRGGAATTGTATNTPAVDGVDIAWMAPATVTPCVSAAAGASVGPLPLAGSTVPPKMISSSTSLHSSITNTTTATTTTTSRAASAMLVLQSVVSSLASAPQQERTPLPLWLPPMMLDANTTASRSGAVTNKSPIVPSLSITDARLDMTSSLHASTTEDERAAPAAATATGRGSAGTCAESANSWATPDGNGGGGDRAWQPPEVYTKHHDNEKVTETLEEQSRIALPPQQQQRRRDLFGGPSAPSPVPPSTSSRRRRHKRNVHQAASTARAVTVVPIPIVSGSQHSFPSARHLSVPLPLPPPTTTTTTSSRTSPACASAGTSSAATAGQAPPNIQLTPEKAAACHSSSGTTGVASQRLFNALHSEHRGGAVAEVRTALDAAAEVSDGCLKSTPRVGVRGGRSVVCATHQSDGSATDVGNTETTAIADSPAASSASCVSPHTLTGSVASLARCASSAATATTLARLASKPATAGPRQRQQRRGASMAKEPPGWRQARQPRGAFISSPAATPRSDAARRSDVGENTCSTYAKREDKNEAAEVELMDTAGGIPLQSCASLPTWRNAAISASPTHSSSDRSRSLHPQRSLLSSWLQSPPVRVATAAGGDDKTILRSPATPASITAILAGGEGLCQCSAGPHQSHSSSGSFVSTPQRWLNAQLGHSLAPATAVGAEGMSFSSPRERLSPMQPIHPVAVAHHPQQQQLLQTTATAHQARKWTSTRLLSSATVSGVLPSVPLAASAQSASNVFRTRAIPLSPSMAHPASVASPVVTDISASPAVGGTDGSGVTAGHLSARLAQPMSPLSSTSCLKQCRHPHPTQVLHLSTSTSSSNTMSTSLAAPCTLPPMLPQDHPPKLAYAQSDDASVLSQHAVVRPRSAAAAALMQTANTLPSGVVSPPSSSWSPRLTPLSTSRLTKPVSSAAASAMSVSSKSMRSGYEAETSARAPVTPDGKTQKPSNAAKVSGKGAQGLSSSPPTGCDGKAAARRVVTQQPKPRSTSLLAHGPCLSPLKRTPDPSHLHERWLQTPSSTRARGSSRRPRAGLPPPLSVETLSDASGSAPPVPNVGTTQMTYVDRDTAKGDIGHGGGQLCCTGDTLHC